ncbi:MAG: ZIP family metal transporter [Caulobacteraceae bacterium]|jgi:ZIP family zinc transporter
MVASAFVLTSLGLAAATATLAGGTLALRLAGRVHIVLALSAGAVVGVALFDLLPEALELAKRPPAIVTAITGAAFMAYLALDRTLARAGDGGQRGHLGASSLTLHSLMDGLAIGLSFQVSAAAAAVVTVAVLAHDLADGVNTVNVSLAGGTDRLWARRWLLADAAAPLVGIALSQFVSVSGPDLGLILAAFAGVFLCIGAGELIPASNRRDWTTTLAILAGCGAIWIVVRLAQA